MGRLAAGLVLAVAMAAGAALSAEAAPPAAYQPITPSAAGETITLTGKDLTIDQVVRIARYGAKVTLSPEARRRSEDNYGLLLEAAAEGVPVYWFNRGAGSEREVEIFSGDPLSPKNKAFLEAHELETFKGSEVFAYGPEVAREDVVRAMMAVRANAMTFDAPSPQLTQMLLDFLNRRITPVVQSRGTVGEGDLAVLGSVGSAMVGQGEVYYQGMRMPAAEALAKAGLKPLQPFAADDNALTSSNAYASGRAALLVHDAQALLEWGDLSYAIDLVGMNSSITPMSLPVQSNLPFAWTNYAAARVLDMVKGSYLFEADPKRVIQDPESMRASPQRAGAAWLAWARLRDTVAIQINASDHNPAVRTDLKPGDSWELSTPQLMKYHVKGGPHSHDQSGYILSNANWDPYPLADDVEAFTLALANDMVVVVQRIERFSNPFFTVITPQQVMKPEQLVGAPVYGGGYLTTDLWQEIEGAMMPVPPEGNAVVATVEDLQAQTRLKLDRATQAVDVAFHLMSLDLESGAFWLDVRRAQDPSRNLGAAPSAAVAALRKVVPLGAPPPGQAGYDFLKATPAQAFYKGAPMPRGAPTPAAQSPAGGR